MGLGYAAAAGIEGGYDALHKMIAERQKQQLLAQAATERQKQDQLQQAEFEERTREFNETNARLAEASGVTLARQKQQDTINEGQRIQNTSTIGDDLSPEQAVTLAKAGDSNTLTGKPIFTMPGLIEKLGGSASPGTEVGGELAYGGNSAQKHQAVTDARAEATQIEQKKRDDAAAARGDKALGISEQRLALAEQNSGGGEVSIVERQPDGSYATVGTMPKGSHLAPNPQTTFQRNQEASRQGAASTIQAIEELSGRINLNQGVYAKISGTVEKQKAKANLDDDVAEYESVISAFTPLVARAVGHTGVLTEQDVQSVRKMFPDPSDSKSLRDRKIARLRSFFKGDAPPAPDGSGGAGDAAKPMTADEIRKKYNLKPGA